MQDSRKYFLFLLLVLAAVLVFGTSGSAYAKSASKIVFYGTVQTDAEESATPRSYVTTWSAAATAVPDPIAKARLMRYSSTKHKWVPVAGRKLRIYNQARTYYWKTVTTNSKGYVYVTLTNPDLYKFEFRGSSTIKRCSKGVNYLCRVETKIGPAFVTVGNDVVGYTRYTVRRHYEYNPYAAKRFGIPSLVSTISLSSNTAGLGTYYDTSTCSFYDGNAFSSFAVEVPAAMQLQVTRHQESAGLTWPNLRVTAFALQ